MVGDAIGLSHEWEGLTAGGLFDSITDLSTVHTAKRLSLGENASAVTWRKVVN